MGSIKDRNGMDLTESEDIKKRWQEHTEELCKKYLQDRDIHDGVITHLQPDILACGSGIKTRKEKDSFEWIRLGVSSVQVSSVACRVPLFATP